MPSSVVTNESYTHEMYHLRFTATFYVLIVVKISFVGFWVVTHVSYTV